MDGGGDGHDDGRHAVAHGVDESFPEATGAGVVEDAQVPDGEEEVQTLQEHPSKAGEEEVVEETCRDGTRQLDGGTTRPCWAPRRHHSVARGGGGISGTWRCSTRPNMASGNLKEAEMLWAGSRLETFGCLFQTELSHSSVGFTHPEEEGTQEP